MDAEHDMNLVGYYVQIMSERGLLDVGIEYDIGLNVISGGYVI